MNTPFLVRGANRERLTLDNRPAGIGASSAGQFVIRADGTATFDRHHHTTWEAWFIAAGFGAVAVGEHTFDVQPGDLVFTPPGVDHDITAVRGGAELRIFWITGETPDGTPPGHLHRDPVDAARHLVPAVPAPIEGAGDVR
ncbi:hypothetical protein Lfu02_75410 [Longispora fulva]|uniref:Mannose-6-phosphate isomerase-like protein (Cupin superfamily) n=1 Tax=Longispora fulva TaxID=619741 RepID=A0A8J7KWA6_9ACTN|nr:cupin domain-containing protein [Longispora fulva]MBG6136322.1 mannose-6-phosphate isomerase-like protein (cupin superfamily) [Longispora fulva]GIG63169.1 hypothetical protein Lfu02_75410 [Longispora fulva]